MLSKNVLFVFILLLIFSLSFSCVQQTRTDKFELVFKGICISAPENPRRGWFYQDFVTSKFYLYNGVLWVDFVQDENKTNIAGQKKILK